MLCGVLLSGCCVPHPCSPQGSFTLLHRVQAARAQMGPSRVPLHSLGKVMEPCDAGCRGWISKPLRVKRFSPLPGISQPSGQFLSHAR